METSVRFKFLSVAFVIMVMLILAACAESGNQTETNKQNHPEEQQKEQEKEQQKEQAEILSPVTLRVLPQNAINNDDMFNRLFVQPVNEKYPHITLERMELGEGQNIDTLVATGDIPDIIGDWNGALLKYTKLEVIEDLQPYVKMYNSDLNRFQDRVLAASAEGSILKAMPYALNFGALYYNKTIFDKFGVAYPEDGMTWEDVTGLAKELTREEGGIQYRGLDPEQLLRYASPRSLTAINTNTNRADVNNDEWKRVLELAREIYSIPGNKPPMINAQGQSMNYFMKDQNVAMYGSMNLWSRLKLVDDLDWDVVQYPSWSDLPNLYGMVDSHINLITTTSKHKDDAFKVIDLISSAEVQTMMTKDLAFLTVLQDPNIISVFAENIPEIKDKNYAGVFRSSPAPSKPLHELESAANNIVKKKMELMLQEGTDINTLLRDAEEEINQLILSSGK